jgi:O-antigen/teichoic acid export membrane protein
MNTSGRQLTHARLARLLGESFWGLADQSIISLTSFFTMVLLARVLTPRDFGAFVLVYGALLFFNALQSGLFTQPHNVLGVTKSASDYVRYTSTTLASQFAFSALLALVAVGASLIARAVGWDFARQLLAMAPAVLAWQTQEYLRRVFYTEGRVRQAFLNDLISYGGQIAAIALIWRAGWLSGSLALLVLAATSTLAAIVALWQLRERLVGSLDGDVVSGNWQFGKWLFGANLVQSGRIQLHLMLIGALVGATAAGLYKAAQNLVAPTHIMMNAYRSIAMPRAAAIHASDGFEAMHRFLMRAALLGLLPIAFYLLLVSLAAEWLLHALYSGQYDGYAWLIWLFSVVYLLAFGGQVLTVVLSAMQVTRAVMIAEVVTLSAAVSIGAPLIWLFEVTGALIADVAIGITLMGTLWYGLQKLQVSPEETPVPLINLVPSEARVHGD